MDFFRFFSFSLSHSDIYIGFYHLKGTHPLTTSFWISFLLFFTLIAYKIFIFVSEAQFCLKMTALEMKQVEWYVTLHHKQFRYWTSTFLHFFFLYLCLHRADAIREIDDHVLSSGDLKPIKWMQWWNEVDFRWNEFF